MSKVFGKSDSRITRVVWQDVAVWLAIIVGMWEGTLITVATTVEYGRLPLSPLAMTLVGIAIVWPIFLWFVALEFLHRSRARSPFDVPLGEWR